MLACTNLEISVPGRMLVASLSLCARPGRFMALLGRNGAGKTLTLHSLAGLRRPQAGAVTLAGTAIDAVAHRERARRLALLPQAIEDPFPVTVLETALIGRHPHIGFWQWEGAADTAIARQALAAVDLGDCESRSVETLSGGERRRLAVACLLAQDPDVCLLDEPTNHLDPQHQHRVLALFRARADAGGAVIASLHDPTLAARFADDVLMLFGDGRWACGPCDSTLTGETLSELYANPTCEIAWRGRRIFVGG